MLIGDDVPKIRACDLKMEPSAHATIEEDLGQFEQGRDDVSRERLRDVILDHTGDQIGSLVAQIELIARLGLRNHLQRQMGAVGD